MNYSIEYLEIKNGELIEVKAGNWVATIEPAILWSKGTIEVKIWNAGIMIKGFPQGHKSAQVALSVVLGILYKEGAFNSFGDLEQYAAYCTRLDAYQALREGQIEAAATPIELN